MSEQNQTEKLKANLWILGSVIGFMVMFSGIAVQWAETKDYGNRLDKLEDDAQSHAVSEAKSDERLLQMARSIEEIKENQKKMFDAIIGAR